MSGRKAETPPAPRSTRHEQEALVGAVVGCLAGWAVKTVGLLALSTLGVLAAGVKGAEDRGYVKVNWAKVNEDTTAVARSAYEQLSAQSVSPRDVRAKLEELTSMNLPGAAGFAQGLLFTCGGSRGRMVALSTAAAGLFSLSSPNFEPHLEELEARLGIKRPLPANSRR